MWLAVVEDELFGRYGLISLFGSSNKRTVKILKDVNGIIKPSRMTLLLGPPSSGKSTLMRALTGKPDKNLKPRLIILAYHD
ncbi:hypothetical protein E2562_003920 [Oryza meyeriana var. granulata]|uniref:ABC transporter domain-containing protein n=1 Tax=Oryza meyeriana var. granulata TaxID=110450 RepID=A0A6G1D0Q4_9ORYZ|nr:hypothetical protein E2562_003920 [Oryza meyeriana var. granulata]